MKKIVFFGDSLTAGYGLRDPEKESIPALISHRLKHLGMDFEVSNAGISGDTTRTAIDRLASILVGDIAVFVLELGANDFLRGHSVREVESNLQTIITNVKKAYPQSAILLLGLELPYWAHVGHGSGFGGIFQNLAKANSIALVPSFLSGVAGNRALNMPDGVHPLAAGYQLATDNILPALLKILKSENR
ncbi:MAG: arylesterase [Chryseobacterium sp.]|nr:MAG: arylesterase [Chryseobacterium sp.]